MTEQEYREKRIELETQKVKHLEKLATSVDILTLWFEEIDKEDWDNRLQFYLNEFHTAIVPSKVAEEEKDE